VIFERSMSRVDTLRKNLRKFRETCERTMRVSGPSPKGLLGVARLRELEAVLAGELPFRGELLEPLSAFSNLLASGGLSYGFARQSFGDAWSALGEVAARANARWRFDPDLAKRAAARLGVDGMGPSLDRLRRDNQRGWEEHARSNRAFVAAAMQRARATGTAVIVGGCRAYDVPLEDIARRFARVIVVDVCDEHDTREGVGKALTDPALIARVAVERFDLTGAYRPFVTEVDAILARTKNENEAGRAIAEFASSYDVPTADVRLCRADVEPDFVVSSMVLTQLGGAFVPFVARAMRERGLDPKRIEVAAFEPSLAALSCRLEQHHIAALLNIPKLAVLTSEVGETAVTLAPNGALVPVGERRTQLSVESLVDRLPGESEPVAQGAWDWLRVVPTRPGAAGASMSVEALVLERR
jgi:hypothetical protein